MTPTELADKIEALEGPSREVDGSFYIADVRRGFRGNPYVTFWRPKNAGYAYPLSWAGRYSRKTIEGAPGYYTKLRDGRQRALSRFPVPCDVVDRVAVEPSPGIIDGDAGPVVPNTAEMRKLLVSNRLRARGGGE